MKAIAITPEEQDLRLSLLLAYSAFFILWLFAQTGITDTPISDKFFNDGLFSLSFYLGQPALFLGILYLSQRPKLPELLPLLLAAGVSGSILLFFIQTPEHIGQFSVSLKFIGYGAPYFIGFALAILIRQIYQWRQGQHRITDKLMLGAVFVFLAFTLYPGPALKLVSALNPATYDTVLFHIDHAFGFHPSIAFASWARNHPLIDSFFLQVYSLFQLAFAFAYGYALYRKGTARVDFIMLSLTAGLAGILLYSFLPVSGPAYLLGDLFPFNPPSLDKIPQTPAVIPIPFPRNGVPSMHFTWVFLLFLGVLDFKKVLGSILAGTLVILVTISTLTTGEHYLIDLVISVPYAIALYIANCRDTPWRDKAKQSAIILCAVLFVPWIVLIRFAPEIFFNSFTLYSASLITIAGSWFAYMLFQRKAQPIVRPAVQTQPASRPVLQVALMFVLSGFAGLMYQVIFSKELALIFGSTATATYTVLTAYMGGMAIGAYLGGRWAERFPNPLRAYAGCEMGIAVYCLATPAIFAGCHELYLLVAADQRPDSSMLLGVRFILGATALTIPTILMGATLPILAQYFKKHQLTLGHSVGVLYAANTLGAATGALITAYFVLPTLGIFKSTILAAGFNLAAAFLAINLAKRVDPTTTEETSPAGTVQSEQLHQRWVFISLTVCGFVCLAVEVNYVHLLSVVAGNSVYAFGLMLFTFLLGLGFGGELSRRIIKAGWPIGQSMGALQALLGVVILAGLFMWDSMPSYFASYAQYQAVKSFAERETVRALVCFTAMFPPAVLIGSLYPLSMEALERYSPQRAIRLLGQGATLNTLGNIAGVITAGFVLLPVIGALHSIRLCAALCICTGVLLLYRGTQARPIWYLAPLAGLLLFVFSPRSFNYDRLASGANVYFSPGYWGKIIDHAESVDGGLTSVAQQQVGNTTLLTLLTNGKFQGNDAQGGEMVAQAGFTLAPLIHTPARERALVIGYGTGMSSHIMHAAGFKDLDVVELSEDVMRLANRSFKSLNAAVTSEKNVHTYITDGRNFLMLQNKKYDVIGMEISSIWFAGAGSLYNQEFYRYAKNRLNPGGVLQQWIQLHHLRLIDALYVIGSVRSQFRYVWLYNVGGQGIIVATNDSAAQPSDAAIARMDTTPALAPWRGGYPDGFGVLKNMAVLTPESTDRLLASQNLPAAELVSTDDNLRLEYGTPKGNALNGPASSQELLKFFSSYR